MAVFAVTMVNGPEWDPAVQRREQAGWREHAAFMDRLLDDGTVILGGPIGDGVDVLLAVEAPDEDTLRAVFAVDPWYETILRIGQIQPWELWLDSRPRYQAASAP